MTPFFEVLAKRSASLDASLGKLELCGQCRTRGGSAVVCRSVRALGKALAPPPIKLLREDRLMITTVDNRWKVSVLTDMDMLRNIFPHGADTLNIALFSTSGVHGSYTTIEEIERWFDNPAARYPYEDTPPQLTVVVVQPRVCSMYCGSIEVKREDCEWLKKLRAQSWDAVLCIGATHGNQKWASG